MNKLTRVAVRGVALLLLLCFSVGTAQARITVQSHYKYGGTNDNYLISNGVVELVITPHYGGGVLSYGYCKSHSNSNVFGTVRGKLPAARQYGWFFGASTGFSGSPVHHPVRNIGESPPATIRFPSKNIVEIVQPKDTTSGIQMSATITLSPKSTAVTVVVQATNRGPYSVVISPWTSAASRLGTAILPQEPFAGSPFDDENPSNPKDPPARAMALWPYTKMGDKCWHWGNNTITLTANAATTRQRLGILDKRGYFFLNQPSGLIITVHFKDDPTQSHPDYDSNVEVYTKGSTVGATTFGPIKTIANGKSVTLVERWTLSNAKAHPAKVRAVHRR